MIDLYRSQWEAVGFGLDFIILKIPPIFANIMNLFQIIINKFLNKLKKRDISADLQPNDLNVQNLPPKMFKLFLPATFARLNLPTDLTFPKLASILLEHVIIKNKKARLPLQPFSQAIKLK